jgi:DNA-binding transcriptional LysR family regulator
MHSEHWQVPPLELLLAFEAAARHLSFTKAGEELHLTQSAVSRQRLYQVAQEILQQLDDTTRKMRDAVAARTVTVSTTPGFASLWLIPRLNGYLQGHQGVDVRISASYKMVNLEHDGVDLAIRYSRADSMQVEKPLFEEEVIPVCSAALAADASRPLRQPADLRAHTLLHMEDPDASWLEWNLWLHAHGLRDLKPAGAMHFSQYDQLVQAAINGQGVALGRLPLLRRTLRDKQLVTPFRKSIASACGYYLMRSGRSSGKRDVSDFEAWLQEEAKKDVKKEAATSR